MLSIAVAFAILASAPADAATGDLLQKTGDAGCFRMAPTGTNGCPLARNIVTGEYEHTSIVTSPDGRNVYVAANQGVAVFDRDSATGTLTQKSGTAGCIVEGAAGGCAGGNGVANATDIALSPDGKSVYVSAGGFYSAGTVAVFDRDPNTGALTQKTGTAGCVVDGPAGACAAGRALTGAISLEVSADGKNVYVIASFGFSAGGAAGAVAIFDRDPSTGALTQKSGAQGCVSEDGSPTGVPAVNQCVDGKALASAWSMTLSQDGKSAYVASFGSQYFGLPGTLAVFDRNPATGALTHKSGAAGCFVQGGSADCADGRGLFDAISVAISPDGANVYVGVLGVATFDRNRDTGALTQKPGALGLYSKSVPSYAVTVSPDGRNLYAAATGDGGLLLFDRDPATGEIAQKTGSAGCIKKSGGSCAQGRSLDVVTDSAVSADGRNAYTISTAFAGGIGIFDRELEVPDTAITAGPAEGASTTDNTPTFAFAATQASARFLCRVDGGAAFACTSPFTTSTLSAGAHILSVAAVGEGRWFDADAPTKTDPTPATRIFTVTPPATGGGQTTPPPGTTPPPDTTPPTARIGNVTCKRRRCTINVSTSDVGGTVASLSAKLTYKVRKCRRVGGRRRCKTVTKTKNLSPRKAVGGFTIKTGKLKRGKYTVSAVATDGAGNRSQAARKTFQVR